LGFNPYNYGVSFINPQRMLELHPLQYVEKPAFVDHVNHVPDGQPLFFHIYSNIYPRTTNTTKVYGRYI
jgi:hypothetical protein